MKYARVFLKGSDNPLRWVDVPLQGDFASFCVTVRMNGCILPMPNWPIWLPFDEIKLMAEIEVNGPSTGARIFGFPTEGKPN